MHVDSITTILATCRPDYDIRPHGVPQIGTEGGGAATHIWTSGGGSYPLEGPIGLLGGGLDPPSDGQMVRWVSGGGPDLIPTFDLICRLDSDIRMNMSTRLDLWFLLVDLTPTWCNSCRPDTICPTCRHVGKSVDVDPLPCSLGGCRTRSPGSCRGSTPARTP